jgi:hypothetical protein
MDLHQNLEGLRETVGAPTCDPPRNAIHSRSSLSIELGGRPVHEFEVLRNLLVNLLQGEQSPDPECTLQAFKDFVFLAPAVIPL